MLDVGMPPQASLKCVRDASPPKCDRRTLSKQSPKPQESNAYRRPPHFFSHRSWPFSTAPSLHQGQLFHAGGVFRSHRSAIRSSQSPHPPRSLSWAPWAPSSLRPRSRDGSPGSGTPAGATPRMDPRSPAPVISGWSPQSLFPDHTLAAPSHPCCQSTWAGASGIIVSPRRRAAAALTSVPHLPLRGYLQCLPHWTPPSRGATLGTIPAAHWLLPRQPVATPLPIGPAPGSSPSLCGAVSQAPGAEYTKEGWS